jgi:hypothetical protein
VTLPFQKIFVLCAVVAGAAGCQPPLIPNTDVEDTDENRRVIEFCETYRRAVERRDIPKLIKMAHADYYENGGTVDTSDDMDRTALNEYLEEKFADTRGIRYEIRYRRVGAGRHNLVFVDYTFSASYKVKTEDGMAWRRNVEDNRLELIPQGEDDFLILSGM